MVLYPIASTNPEKSSAREFFIFSEDLQEDSGLNRWEH